MPRKSVSKKRRTKWGFIGLAFMGPYSWQPPPGGTWAISGVVRKPPAFSTPVYSDSYLPAAMQVIFHAVEQLKVLESESQNKTAVNYPLPSPMTQTVQNVRPSAQAMPTATSETKPNETVENKNDDTKKQGTPEEINVAEKFSETTQKATVMETSTGFSEFTEMNDQESPEMNAETPETNYATPEVNYELPEDVHEVQETNEEVPEVNEMAISVPLGAESNASIKETKLETSNTTDLTSVDCIVKEIYEIVKPTPSVFTEEDSSFSTESKSSSRISVEKVEATEDEEEETRFTLLGEKVTQVPRPSLSSYLRRTKVPASATLQQLANLYDSLSKDARKQGFGKYTGYSDDVLSALKTSAEGGMGPQLKTIFKKVVERNELTREDAKTKIMLTLRDLENPSSNLSKALRNVLPLRYSP